MRALVPILVLAGTSYGQVNLEDILARLAHTEESRRDALHDYQVMRRYQVDGERFSQRAEMEVRGEYKSPGSKRFDVLSESGSGLIRSRVLRKLLDAEVDAAREEMRDQIRIDSQNYTFRHVGMETVNGHPAHVIELTPLAKNKYLINGRIWVDVEDAAIVRLEGAPVSGTGFWIRGINMVQTYRKVGSFWLLDSNRTDANVRLFGPARLNIVNYDYQVNRSLLAAR